MLNLSLKQNGQMLYIPNEERISAYLKAIVFYYETGDYSKFRKYFIEEYKETIDTIFLVEKSKAEEMSRGLRG